MLSVCVVVCTVNRCVVVLVLLFALDISTVQLIAMTGENKVVCQAAHPIADLDKVNAQICGCSPEGAQVDKFQQGVPRERPCEYCCRPATSRWCEHCHKWWNANVGHSLYVDEGWRDQQGLLLRCWSWLRRPSS